MYLGKSYEAQSNPKKALSAFSDAIKYSPEEEAYLNRALLYNKKGQYKDAIEDLTEAIRLNPKSAMSYYNRGIAYLKLNKRNDACLDFSKAGELGQQEAYEMIKKRCN